MAIRCSTQMVGVFLVCLILSAAGAAGAAEAAERQAGRETENAGRQAMREKIPGYSSNGPQPLRELTENLSVLTKVKFHLADDVQATINVKFENKSPEEMLNATLYPIGLEWRWDGAAIEIVHRLKQVRAFQLKPETRKLVQRLHEEDYLPEVLFLESVRGGGGIFLVGDPGRSGVEITFGKKIDKLIVRGYEGEFAGVERLFARLEALGPTAEVKRFDIEPRLGPKIQTVAEAVLHSRTESGKPREPLVYAFGGTLLVVGTPEELQRAGDMLVTEATTIDVKPGPPPSPRKADPAARERELEEKNRAILRGKIPGRYTNNPMPLSELLGNLEILTDLKFDVRKGVDAASSVTIQGFDSKSAEELLNETLAPLGYGWSLKGEMITIRSKLEERARATLLGKFSGRPGPPSPLAEWLNNWEILTDLKFDVRKGVDASVKVDTQECKSMEEILNEALAPQDCEWSLQGGVITIKRRLYSKFFLLDELNAPKVKNMLNKGWIQRVLYGETEYAVGRMRVRQPPHEGVQLILDEGENLIFIHDTKENIEKLGKLLATTPPLPGQLAMEKFSIDPAVGPQVKTMLEAIYGAREERPTTHAAAGYPKVFLLDENLFVKGLPEDIQRAKEVMAQEELLKMLKAGELEVRVFDITPRESVLREPQLCQDYLRRVKEVVRTILYSMSSVRDRNRSMRQMWLDEGAFWLTVLDYPSNLRRVANYIHQEVEGWPYQWSIRLEHAHAGELVKKLKAAKGFTFREKEFARGGDAKLPFVAPEEPNAVLIKAATSEQYEAIRAWLREHDVAARQILVQTKLIKGPSAEVWPTISKLDPENAREKGYVIFSAPQQNTIIRGKMKNWRDPLPALYGATAGNVINGPRVLVMDGKEAEFWAGRNKGGSGGFGNSAPASLTDGFSMKVAPMVLPDGEIELDLRVMLVIPATTAGAELFKRETAVKVKLKDGETAALKVGDAAPLKQERPGPSAYYLLITAELQP